MALSRTLSDRYIDIDIGFSRNPVTSDVNVRKDVEAIKRSIRNLVSLNRYEKPFHPEIYSGVYDMLFELMDPVTVLSAKDRLESLITRYEPRVNQALVNIYQVEETNEIAIVINFTIYNAPTTFSTTIMVERLR